MYHQIKFIHYMFNIVTNHVFKIQNINNLCIYCNELYLYKLCVILCLHINFQAKYLIDICVFDFPEKKYRLHFSYNIFSLIYNVRFMIYGISKNRIINSLSNLFIASNWMERECWDLFGIQYMNHPDLRRILTDYGFNSFPMRKDFPLIGFFESRFDSSHKCVLHFNVKLVHEYRFFSYISGR